MRSLSTHEQARRRGLMYVVVKDGTALLQQHSFEVEPLRIRRCAKFLASSFASTLSIVSEAPTSKVMYLPVKVLT